ncbi:MAG: ACT domain-containing protein, partial [Gammaproteobacteria bacterium]
VQIRTVEMDDVAEAGIAAHWLYKSGGGRDASNAHKRAREWLRGILDIQRTAGDSQEFLENVKIDLFPDAVYLFTPKGEIMELPKSATAVDMAYAIHTDVGNKCVGVRIDKRLVPLGTRLETGQTVEIITAPGARPNPAWLNFVVTAKARANIRHYLKNLKHNEAANLGKRLLNRELDMLGLSIDALDEEAFQQVLQPHKLTDQTALLEAIGLGNLMPMLIARELAVASKHEIVSGKVDSNQNHAPLTIKGTEGMVVTFPKCCYPIPGDPIQGFVSAGRGIVVHHQSCKNIAEFRNQPDKWINVEWESKIDRDFLANIRLDVTNQRGVLATLATTIADQEANIINVEVKDCEDRYTTLKFELEVRDRQHLAQVMRRLHRIKHVTRVSRN